MNDYLQILGWVVILAVAGYAVYAATRRGEVINASGVLEAVHEAQSVALQVKEIVQVAVNAAEQLKREGAIQSNDAAFNHALDLAKAWIPDEWEVPNADIIEMINASVLVASALARQAGVSSQDGKAGQASGQP